MSFLLPSLLVTCLDASECCGEFHSSAADLARLCGELSGLTRDLCT